MLCPASNLKASWELQKPHPSWEASVPSCPESCLWSFYHFRPPSWWLSHPKARTALSYLSDSLVWVSTVSAFPHRWHSWTSMGCYVCQAWRLSSNFWIGCTRWRFPQLRHAGECGCIRYGKVTLRQDSLQTEAIELQLRGTAGLQRQSRFKQISHKLQVTILFCGDTEAVRYCFVAGNANQGNFLQMD